MLPGQGLGELERPRVAGVAGQQLRRPLDVRAPRARDPPPPVEGLLQQQVGGLLRLPGVGHAVGQQPAGVAGGPGARALDQRAQQGHGLLRAVGLEQRVGLGDLQLLQQRRAGALARGQGLQLADGARVVLGLAQPADAGQQLARVRRRHVDPGGQQPVQAGAGAVRHVLGRPLQPQRLQRRRGARRVAAGLEAAGQGQDHLAVIRVLGVVAQQLAVEGGRLAVAPQGLQRVGLQPPRVVAEHGACLLRPDEGPRRLLVAGQAHERLPAQEVQVVPQVGQLPLQAQQVLQGVGVLALLQAGPAQQQPGGRVFDPRRQQAGDRRRVAAQVSLARGLQGLAGRLQGQGAGSPRGEQQRRRDQETRHPRPSSHVVKCDGSAPAWEVSAPINTAHPAPRRAPFGV